MNELYATINFSKQKFILNGVDLISGDYNSTKIKFTFEDNQDKTKVIEIRPATSEDKNPTFMATITNNEVILTSKDEDDHNVTPFTTGGVYYMEISAYSDDSKLSTITKSFNVLEEQIILSDEIVSPYLPVFDELIEEIIRVTDEASNVNIDITKNNNITTVTITNRDGVVKTVQILDGKDGIDGKDGEDGEDGVGIESIEKISTSGLVDTYRITLTNNEYYDYEITNGNGIVSIEKTGTAGNIDTYTITYSNGTTSTFTVTNSEVTEEEFEELQSQVNELSLYVNALPKVTGTGTEVTLNDTANCPMPMSLRPSATSQDGTPTPETPIDINTVSGSNTITVEGKNLFDLENSSWSGTGASNMKKINNGFEFNSIAASGLQYAYDINKNYLAGTYTYSHIANGSSSRIYIRIRKKDDSGWMTSSDTSIPGMSYVSVYNGWFQYFSTLEVEKTFTIPDCLYWNIGIGYNSGVTVPKTITNIQIEKGTTTATSYLPYTKYTLALNLPVENLFNKNNTTILNAYVSDSAISGQDNQARLVIIPVKPNTTYTISKLNRGFDGSHQWMERIAEFSSVPTYSTSFIVRYTNVGMSYTFTTSANTNYIVYDVAYGTDYVSNLQDYIDTIQLEKGTKVNSYTPYGTTPIELCKIGNYEDYFYKDSGKWYLHKEIIKLTFDGTETGWTKYQGINYDLYTKENILPTLISTDYGSGETAPALSNLFENILMVSGQMTDKIGFAIWEHTATTSDLRVFCATNYITTLNDFKALLSNKNMILYGAMVTPTNTEITDTTLISQLEAIYNWATSYQDQTNITQENNDLPFVITASAIYDLSNLLN